MLLVSPSLLIALFAWFAGQEDEDKGVGCLQPRGTCTSGDRGGPWGTQPPWLVGSLLPSEPSASTLSPSVISGGTGGHRQEANEGSGQSTPYFQGHGPQKL